VRLGQLKAESQAVPGTNGPTGTSVPTGGATNSQRTTPCHPYRQRGPAPPGPRVVGRATGQRALARRDMGERARFRANVGRPPRDPDGVADITCHNGLPACTRGSPPAVPSVPRRSARHVGELDGRIAITEAPPVDGIAPVVMCDRGDGDGAFNQGHRPQEAELLVQVVVRCRRWVWCHHRCFSWG